MRLCVLRHQFEAPGDVAPQTVEILAGSSNSLIVESIEAAGSLGVVGHESGCFEQPKVPRHCRAADRQRVGELLHGVVTTPEQLDYRSAIGVAERDEGIDDDRLTRDCIMVTGLLP